MPLETIWEAWKKWPNFYLNECMCLVSYVSADIQKQARQKQVGDQTSTVSKTNKHRTWLSTFTDEENACL